MISRRGAVELARTLMARCIVPNISTKGRTMLFIGQGKLVGDNKVGMIKSPKNYRKIEYIKMRRQPLLLKGQALTVVRLLVSVGRFALFR
jgi:hypothetical protein